ncbi:flavin reductase family protein [Mycobacterium asiaticum]|uniref:flavin reductase family protein n=1 Tax=Mycobacterium asiaticum TaxID=1790 RepID=UPI000B013D4C|nr:flavin reductase family protein [Mycobacterium asiaticum]
MSGKSLFQLTKMMNNAMAVVTTKAGDHRSGCLVGFSTQVNIHPPLLLVGMSKANHTFTVAAGSEHLAVHLLSPRDTGLAELFGGETEDEIDKFDRCAWHTGPNGMPILDDAVAWMVGSTLDRIDFGDHVGYLLQPVETWFAEQPSDVLHFVDVIDVEPGHEP